MATSHSSYQGLSILCSAHVQGQSSISPGIPQALLCIPFPLVGHSFPHFVLVICLSVPFCFEVPIVTEPLRFLFHVFSRPWL